PSTFLKIGLAFADFLGNEGVIIVGRDNRFSSISYKMAFISGVTAGGVDVIDVDLAPTPAVLHAIKEMNADGGAVITGSHTPEDINGIMLFKEDTSELTKDEEEELEDIFNSEKHNLQEWDSFGQVINEEEPIEEIYANSIEEKFNFSKFTISEIIIDSGNGAMSNVMGNILENFGFHVIRINDYGTGDFPFRDPYPREETLTVLSRLSAKLEMVGIGVDGDGDRAIFTDDLGRIIPGDIIGTIFAVEELKKKKIGDIVVPINTSLITQRLVEKYNGRVHYTKVGPPNIVKKMIDTNAIFGFEETGKYIWPENIYYGDALYSALKLLELLSNRETKLSELVNKLPQFYQKKIALPCPDKIKETVLSEIRDIWTQISHEKNMSFEIIDMDGIKFVYPELDTWILFRPSGTEPQFRVYIESKDKKLLEDLIQCAIEKTKKVIEKYKIG
ncbi:MAG: hypothetical protein J7L47_03735, partial [Candidatus Odinarchaeota archaeon]|nr:hypothetical protein [Candidatus Odinarchaeota archaeon]